MKYYKLELALEEKIIGKYPQSTEVKNLADINKMYNYGWEGPIKNLPAIPMPILNSKAKPTTFLSIHINKLIFLVVKNCFVDFLATFNVGNFQFWSIEVEHSNKVLREYVLFHLSNPSQEELVNFEDSQFLIGKLGDWKDPNTREPVKVTNYYQYCNLIEVLKESEDNLQIRCNKLILNLSNIKKDIFRLSNIPFGNGYYVSERLKSAIENEHFTGLKFKEIEKYNKYINTV